MNTVQPSPLPAAALLAQYAQQGDYTDCYVTDISIAVSQQQYVLAFYTTFIFKIERFILRWVLSKPSTDKQAQDLADGVSDTFAAWQVESRAENQLLLCDFQGRTRLWLMVIPTNDRSGDVTRLFFGSAVIRVNHHETALSLQTWRFKAMLKFHKFYSVVLLRATKARLLRQHQT